MARLGDDESDYVENAIAAKAMTARAGVSVLRATVAKYFGGSPATTAGSALGVARYWPS